MNYIGSKLSLLDFLDESIGKITGLGDGVFCDLFAGTGVVGLHFKNKGFEVISNDIQYYSYILNKHFIGNNEQLKFEKLDEIILKISEVSTEKRAEIVCRYLDNIEPLPLFIFENYSESGTKTKEFQRKYFTDYNAKKCDAIRVRIEEWKKNGYINENEYCFLLACLIESVDKIANTASVYGAFLKSIKKSAKKRLDFLPLPLYPSQNKHSVYNKNANDLAKEIAADIVYIDPPYNHRQYSANYHILETIALYDNPKIKGVTGLRSETIKKSKYCSTLHIKKEFSELIGNIKAKYIFVSYNDEGLLTKDEMKEILSTRGTYGVIEKEYKRFQADINEKRNIKKNKTIEYLHYVKCF